MTNSVKKLSRKNKSFSLTNTPSTKYKIVVCRLLARKPIQETPIEILGIITSHRANIPSLSPISTVLFVYGQYEHKQIIDSTTNIVHIPTRLLSRFRRRTFVDIVLIRFCRKLSSSSSSSLISSSSSSSATTAAGECC